MHIGIPAQLRRGHDHRDAVIRGIALDRGSALPDGVVVAHAVQQIQHGVFAFSANALHADLAVGLFGQNHVHLLAHPQHIGEKVYVQKCHDSFPPIYLYFIYPVFMI